MLYDILRVSAQFALCWYYSELIVQGREHIPMNGPVLVVANHPNALVDAMIVSTTVRRRVLITARATLFDGRTLAGLLRRIGVVPLLRVQDVGTVAGAPGLLARNDASLERVTDALRQGEVVLIFPEGISHDRPSMAPLKSGAARIALQALAKGAPTLHILPVGLVYEEKERPRTRVLVKIGRPISVGTWLAKNSTRGAAALTQEIALELRRVTLNFATEERAVRTIRLARAFSLLRAGFVETTRGRDLVDEVLTAGRVEMATEALEQSPPALQVRADVLIGELKDLETSLAQRGIALQDALVASRVMHGVSFVVREMALACVFIPLAFLGRVSHWLPLRAARRLTMYTLRSDPSRDQPAMRTILVALVTVPVWYVIQAAVITTLAGGFRAAIWLAVCFVGANVDAKHRERIERAWHRTHAFLVYRGDRVFQDTLVVASRELLEQAADLELALSEIRGHAS